MVFGILLYALIAIVIMIGAGIAVEKGLTVQHIKRIYLYLVSLVSLIIIIVGAIMLLNMALKTWVFTKADTDYYGYRACPTEVVAEDSTAKEVKCDEEEEKRLAEERRVAQKQRDAAQAIAMIVVASPVFYYHWRLARRES